MTPISMSAEQFGTLMNVISFLKKSCDDLAIRDGRILQRSNSRFMIFDIDMSSIVNDSNITIAKLDQKEKILSLFKKEGSDISIIPEESGFVVQDEHSKISIISPDIDLISNDQVDVQKVSNIFDGDSLELIGEFKAEKYLIDRLKLLSDALSSRFIRLKFNEDNTLNINIESSESSDYRESDRTPLISGVVETIENISMDRSCFTIVPLEAFKIPSDSFDCSLYKEVNKGGLFTVLKTSIGSEDSKVDFKVYIKTSFKEDE